MRIAYSCLVDSSPKYEWEAWLWLHSLITFGLVDPADIFVHCLPNLSRAFYGVLRRLHVNVVPTKRLYSGFIGAGACNKFQQYLSPFEHYDQIVFMDCDILITRPAHYTTSADISGTVCIRPHPPLNVFRELYTSCGLKEPAAVETVKGGLTFSSNLSAGILVVQQKELKRIKDTVHGYIQYLITCELPDDIRTHTEQIALAMTLDALQSTIEIMSARSHFILAFESRYSNVSDILAYHYSGVAVLPSGLFAAEGEYAETVNQVITSIMVAHPRETASLSTYYSVCVRL